MFKGRNMGLKRLILISILAALIYVLELVFLIIPNVSLTFFLIIVFSKILKLDESIYMVLIYLIIDIFISSSSFIFIIPSSSLLLIPILLNTLFKNIDNSFILAILSILFTLVYTTSYSIFNSIYLNINIKDYLIADIPFTIILIISNFLITMWLYEKVSKEIRNIIID